MDMVSVAKSVPAATAEKRSTAIAGCQPKQELVGTGAEFQAEQHIAELAEYAGSEPPAAAGASRLTKFSYLTSKYD